MDFSEYIESALMSKIAILKFIKSGYAIIKQCNNSLFRNMVALQISIEQLQRDYRRTSPNF